MWLPHLSTGDVCLNKVDIGLNSIPWDSGITNRPGPHHGPRQLWGASTIIRAEIVPLDIRPFEFARVADLGDVAPNQTDV